MLTLLPSGQVLRYGASRRDAAQLAPAALQPPPPEPEAANPLDPVALAGSPTASARASRAADAARGVHLSLDHAAWPARCSRCFYSGC
jgi:hypothetical protein